MFLFSLIPSLFCMGFLYVNGNVETGILLGNYIGILLVGAAYISIAMLMACMTESQIIAAVVTFGVLLLLYLWESLCSFLPAGAGANLGGVIVIITVVALLAALGLEVYEMFTEEGYFREVNHVLHNLLTIVVGLEFVRMLIDTTPANILEVLTVAITRHVILSHENPWSNIASIACIAGLFAIRRFLIRRHELKEEMVEQD